MLHRMRSKESMSAPRPTYMSDQQMSLYLEDLRTNRIPRPNGSRPAPAPSIRRSRHQGGISEIASQAHPVAGNDVTSRTPARSSSVLSNTMKSMRSGSGTIIAQALRREASVGSSDRAKEKQDAHEVRIAMEILAVKDDSRIYEEAQAEAVDLIRRHENPDAPYQVLRKWENSEQEIPRATNSTLNAVSVSDTSPQGIMAKMPTKETISIKIAKRGTVSVNEAGKVIAQEEQQRRTSIKLSGHFSITSMAKGRRSGSGRNFSGRTRSGQFPNAREKIYEDPSEEVVTSPITPPVIISPPEAVEEPTPTAPTRPNPFQRVRSTRYSLPTSTHRASYTSTPSARNPDRIEIQRNAPSQSRNPAYTSNPIPEPVKQHPAPILRGDSEPILARNSLEIRSDDIRAATSMRMKDRSERLRSPAFVSDSPGRPIVSFQPDWKPRDVDPVPRSLLHQQELLHSSPRPPTAPRPQVAHLAHNSVSVTSTGSTIPLVVVNNYTAPMASKIPSSDRPIPSISICNVPSFEVPSITIDDTSRNSRRYPTATDRPPPPSITINEPPSITTNQQPTISITEPPTILIDEPSKVSSASKRIEPHRRPPIRAAHSAPNHALTTPHQNPSAIRRTTALCANCALAIAGRIVTAAGTRFHPECFTCFHCDTGLECVAFYPEPDTCREERLARIQSRKNGEMGVMDRGGSAAEDDGHDDDGDAGLRFYCHLDFHETFSPRCKSCKTPIEGEVVLACGAEWHQGHFFCAQCGDPFDPTTPFIERDGFAWCVGCHTNRVSAKCKRCRKPVTETVVEALGAEWHEQCFCCTKCQGAFSDGRYFLRGASEDPVCFACEERRLKG